MKPVSRNRLELSRPGCRRGPAHRPLRPHPREAAECRLLRGPVRELHGHGGRPLRSSSRSPTLPDRPPRRFDDTRIDRPARPGASPQTEISWPSALAPCGSPITSAGPEWRAATRTICFPCLSPRTRCAHVVARVRAVSDILERPLILENASTYAEFASSTMPEWEFFGRLMEEADCGCSSRLNNVYVSASNHGSTRRPTWTRSTPRAWRSTTWPGTPTRGLTSCERTTDRVSTCGELYRHSVARTGNVATLLEWDADIPEFEVVHAEALKSRAFRLEEKAVAAAS